MYPKCVTRELSQIQGFNHGVLKYSQCRKTLLSTATSVTFCWHIVEISFFTLTLELERIIREEPSIRGMDTQAQ